MFVSGSTSLSLSPSVAHRHPLSTANSCYHLRMLHLLPPPSSIASCPVIVPSDNSTYHRQPLTLPAPILLCLIIFWSSQRRPLFADLLRSLFCKVSWPIYWIAEVLRVRSSMHAKMVESQSNTQRQTFINVSLYHDHLQEPFCL